MPLKGIYNDLNAITGKDQTPVADLDFTEVAIFHGTAISIIAEII